MLYDDQQPIISSKMRTYRGFFISFVILVIIFVPPSIVRKNDANNYSRLNKPSPHCIIVHGDSVCENPSIDQGRSYNNVNIDISYCFFTRTLVYSDDDGSGGVIRVAMSSKLMNISSSMFYNCACSNGEGAIFFESSNLYLRKICANGCSATNYQFGFLKGLEHNRIEFLSVTNCSYKESGLYSSRIESGEMILDNTNFSMNKALEGSSFLISNPTSFTSIHCTVSNNKAGSGKSISFNMNSGNMSYANIVGNNSPFSGVVYVHFGSANMMYCIFTMNQDYLFNINSGSLILSCSIIDHVQTSFSTKLNVSTENSNLFTSTNTYSLQFFNSHFCNTDFPERTIEETLMRTIEETLMRTIVDTPEKTLDTTIENTKVETLINTPEMTLDTTIENTKAETLINTPENTIDGDNKGMSSIMVFLTVVLSIGMITGLAFGILFLVKNNQDTSHPSESIPGPQGTNQNENKEI